jgi:hypothetical protein
VGSHTQQIIERLAKRLEDTQIPVKCTLGLKPLPRRGGACSECPISREFELDEAVAELVNMGAFKGTSLCPHRIIASHLVARLVFGPEGSRARSAGQYRVDPVVEIKGALKRIGAITRSTALTREDVEAISNKDEWWQALSAVYSAEYELQMALAIFRSQPPSKTPSRRGPIGALHIQTVAIALALAWRVLTGQLPGKTNKNFHDLLLAAVATIFGHPAKGPNLEAATRTAVRHIKQAPSRT